MSFFGRTKAIPGGGGNTFTIYHTNRQEDIDDNSYTCYE